MQPKASVDAINKWNADKVSAWVSARHWSASTGAAFAARGPKTGYDLLELAEPNAAARLAKLEKILKLPPHSQDFASVAADLDELLANAHIESARLANSTDWQQFVATCAVIAAVTAMFVSLLNGS